jgi:peptidoglycan/xylan/chitin deacetylase (PgdA/CDA1 family)
VLCYHSVHPEQPFATPPGIFAEQLRWLKQNVRVIPFESITAEAAIPDERSTPAVAITFDDGYADNYEFAVPLLVSHDLRATFFLTTGLLDREPEVMQRFARERGAAGGAAPLGWNEVRDMARLGMGIGAHTVRHHSLAQLDVNSASEEMRVSRMILEDKVGISVYTMAYPYGVVGRDVSVRTLELAAGAGYRFAATTLARSLRRNDNPLAIPRFIVEADKARTLAMKVSGSWDLFGLYRERQAGWRRDLTLAIQNHDRSGCNGNV